MDSTLLAAIVAGIAILLILILKFKIQAFIALLISSICVGIIAGIEPVVIMKTIQTGMGNTLGFVAVVVGLGAIFGAILEHSRGAEAIAAFLLQKAGDKGAPWALMLTGFLVAVPVFFDVAFIILVPLIYSLQRASKKSLLLYAIPLLAGLAITHAFVPPTPGPVAVADILDADLGWVIVFGFVVGIPTAIVTGPLLAKYLSRRIHADAPDSFETARNDAPKPPVAMVLAVIGLPILLIVFNTVLNSPMCETRVNEAVKNWMGMIGHPFTALILANLTAWYLLGVRRSVAPSTLMEISAKSMAPAGIIILVTGAGGVFKEMLITTGIGDMMARYFSELRLSSLLFAFVVAALVRILQGSATVSMITAAGVTAPMLSNAGGEGEKALLVIAIASGASIMSHVNDSGFWLVSKYLGLSEKQTFMSWTLMTTLLSLVSMLTISLISLFV